MKVLVIGSGGREHALCWKLRQSPLLTELYCAPGSSGISNLADTVPISPDEIHQLADFAADLKIDLTIVGPELPLSLGLVNEFQSRGMAIFGPRKQAAELESSKVFAKRFMERHGIPTARFNVVHDQQEARRSVEELGLPIVLKADGLAAGKGVFVVHEAEELETALATLFEERRFGAASDRVIVEEFLEGEEVSFLALCDGERLLSLATSKDYKRIGDGDTGPNTGGMGAHSPSLVMDSELAAVVVEQVMRPVVAGMKGEDRLLVGVLYAGLVLTAEGPKVLEFNLRLGDPETQPLLMRIEDDLLPVLLAGATGGFETGRLTFRKEAAVCLVLASEGYPGKPNKGEIIEGLEAAAAHPGVEIFHAGTALRDGKFVATGGRVLNVCASGSNLLEALKKAYAAAAEISWPSKVLRYDIGRRVLGG
ncbi:MAG: phosphoribosylamine--glycine ligase [Deltaproteobacteria bacterium]|nr:phosphoribosylamine--glycine ligase [Deltaproteobacteria bacterium]